MACWADMHMMAGFAAMERSEKQWFDLVEGTGLKIVKFWFPEESLDGVIELTLEEEVKVKVNGVGGAETHNHV